MRNKILIKDVSLAYGLLITFLLILILVPKIISKIMETGFTYLLEIPKSIIDWSDPMAFFLIYLTGYIIVLWKPLWGSILIIFVSVFYVIIEGFDGPPIFAIPTFFVGLFYLLYWIVSRKKINTT